MKAIIARSIDNWGEQYSVIELCEDDKVDETIAEMRSLSTEIVETEVVDVYNNKSILIRHRL